MDAAGVSYEWLLMKIVLAMTVITVAAFVILKFVLPRFLALPKSRQGRITILDRHQLDYRRVIYLVKIDDKKVAVAMSDHGVATLAEWAET